MKFRKRKDLIQRKRYKQIEAISVLDSYLENSSNTEDRENSSYSWTSTLDSVSMKTSGVPQVPSEPMGHLLPDADPADPKVPTAGTAPKGCSKGTCGTLSKTSVTEVPIVSSYKRLSLFEKEMMSLKGVPKVPHSSSVHPEGITQLIPAVGTFGSAGSVYQRYKISLELLSQTNYHGLSSPERTQQRVSVAGIYDYKEDSIRTAESTKVLADGVATYGARGIKEKGHRHTITKLRNRCIQTNRSRSVSKLMKISRQQIRRLGVKGSLTGCTKSTW